MFKLLGTLTPRHVLLLCALFGLTLTVGAFVLEYGFDAKPCHLCWLQRYGHWALAACALLGYLWPRLTTPAFTGVLASTFYGLALATYHTGVEQKIFPAPEGCSSTGALSTNMADFMASLSAPSAIVPCDQVGFTLFGLSLAAWNIFAMAGVLIGLFVWWRAVVR